MCDSVAAAAAAASDASNMDVSRALEQKMAKMQKDLEQMQQVQGMLKNDDNKFLKSVQSLQRDLEGTTKKLSAAQAKKQKLHKELQACEEEIGTLEKEKQSTTNQIYAASADAERKKADKLREVSGNLGLGAALQTPTHGTSQSTPPDLDLLACLDFAGPTATASGSTAPPAMADLLDMTQSTPAPQIGATSVWNQAAAPPQSFQPSNLGMAMPSYGGLPQQFSPSARPGVQPAAGLFNAFGGPIAPDMAAPCRSLPQVGANPSGMSNQGPAASRTLAQEKVDRDFMDILGMG